jgi:hypothetical protein
VHIVIDIHRAAAAYVKRAVCKIQMWVREKLGFLIGKWDKKQLPGGKADLNCDTNEEVLCTL